MNKTDLLALALLAAVVVAWYVRRERRTFDVDGVGRVLKATPEEAAFWEAHYREEFGE